ncbi:MAG: hypothetical protein J6Z18_05620, partial [Prevotella sp.]|nr:hypothetical protein [Prevotella sp.]
AYPSFDSTHKQVYAIGDIKCDGTVLSEDATYTNDKDAASQIPPHNYVDGVCIECGQFDPALVPVVDGWYEVSTPEQLLSISELVNGGKYDINVRLTADIDLGGISYFPPIGKQYYPVGPTLYFSGTFDGQGHIICNLNIDKDDPGAETGLFGRLNGATVQNVGIVNATFKNPHALRAGVLGACAVSSTIINCFTAGNIAMEECICEYENRNGGGLIGLITSGTVVSNCYTTYGTLGAEAGVTNIQNCYWGEDVTNMAPTGELCYKLGPSFRQNIGEDPYPIFDPTHGIVKKITDAGYATMYIPETSVTIPTGVEAYTGTINGSLLVLSPLQNVVIKGQAVVLKGNAGYYSFNPTDTGAGLIQSDLLGTANPLEANGSQYVLAQKDDVIGFYKAEGTIAAGKAYLDIAGGSVKGFTLSFDGETGIETIDNGQLTMDNAVIYDLSGRRIEKMQKGIFIVNGKKMQK